MTTPYGLIPGSEPHVAALLEQMRAETPDSLIVELGVAPAAPGDKQPYAVMYPDGGQVRAARLDGGRRHIEISFLMHAVGQGPEQALWVTDHIRRAALSKIPVVEGRSVRPVYQDGYPSPLMRDWNSQPPRFNQIIELILCSDHKE